ncbi:MAG: DnaJ domain-containing protein [Spirochaetales bacterium]|nr:DnaJ domain-containing protein [Spirochaetales bacterium]
MLLKDLTSHDYTLKIRSFLEKQTRPVYESTLLYNVYPEYRNKTSSIDIYQYHFAVMRLLYQLQDELRRENIYLHVHFMRIKMLPYPQNGFCHEYLEDIGCFCGSPILPPGNRYCPFHARSKNDDLPEQLSVKYFYLSDKNYDAVNANNADAFLSGTWELLYHYDEYINAVRTLELPEHCSMEMVRQNYRRLAKKYHPDLNNGIASAEFLNINDAYQILQKILPYFNS